MNCWGIFKTSSMICLGFFVIGLSIPRESLAQGNRTYVERSPLQKGLLDAGAVGASVIYTPIKACYAVGGTIAGGLVFLMSAGQSSTAAGLILQRSTRGDWFVHPDHLTGQRRLRFRGSPAIGGGR